MPSLSCGCCLRRVLFRLRQYTPLPCCNNCQQPICLSFTRGCLQVIQVNLPNFLSCSVLGVKTSTSGPWFHHTAKMEVIVWCCSCQLSITAGTYGYVMVGLSVPRATWKESTLSCGPDCDAVLVSKPSEYEDSTILVELV